MTTIFVKNEWGWIGTGGYNVIGFSQRGKNSAQRILDKINSGEECWVCLKATFEDQVKESDLKGCFISLAKIEATKEPLHTLDHITCSAARAKHRRDENGKFIWPFCLKVTEICHAKRPYEDITKIIPNPDYKGSNMRSVAKELLPHESKAVKDFFEQRKFKWRSLKRSNAWIAKRIEFCRKLGIK